MPAAFREQGMASSTPMNLDFPAQFVLDRSDRPVPGGWRVSETGSWRLAWHPRLPVTTLTGPDGAPAGWLLGIAVSGHAVLSESKRLANLPGATLVEKIRRLGGRFAAVVLRSGDERVLVDACGSYALVFSPRAERVAASPELFAEIPGHHRSQDLLRSLELPERDAWFPFGITSRVGVERLLPNHYLDLETWRVHRHWPSRDLSIASGEPEVSTARIADVVSETIGALAAATPLQMPLTAGRDSRMLLACARRWADEIRFYTTALPDETARIDCQVAARIAARHGLSYRKIPWAPASDSESEAWLHRTGYVVSGRIRQGIRTEEQLDPDRVNVLGLAGEVGRCAYWRENDTVDRSLTPSDVLSRLELPALPTFIDRAEQWLEEVGSYDALTVLDLLYLEQRLGCWAGPTLHGSVRPRFAVLPFANTALFEQMLALPHEFRRRERLSRDLIASRWRQLLELPFNQARGWLRARQVVGRGGDLLWRASRAVMARLTGS